MYTFKSDEGKTLSFTLKFENVESEDVKGYLRINIDGVEYSFDGKFNENGKFEVNVPPLGEVIKKTTQSGSYPARLEMVGPDHSYFNLWEEDIYFQAKKNITVETVEEVANSAAGIKGMDNVVKKPEMRNTANDMFDKKAQVQDKQDMDRLQTIKAPQQNKAEKDMKQAAKQMTEKTILPSWFK